MKTNREDSFAATKSAFRLSAFLRHNMRWGGLAALILMLSGVQLQLFVPAALAEPPTEGKNGGAQQWSVQVDKVDSGDANRDPSFGAAIYENLLEELVKTKHFKQVFRSGDRIANDVPDALILKTMVQTYTPGSETRRAVTTVTGATKLNVRIQLFTREGHLVLEQVVEGDVRFVGNNLRATHNLAHNVAGTLKRSTLPEPTTLVAKQETGKTSEYQVGTITAVQYQQEAGGAEPSVFRYDVSVRVGNMVYVVLYTAPLGTDTIGYAAGRDLLVLVEENTLTYNDMLGNSLQVPILGRATVTPQGSR
jgi:hypothetical protein